MATLLFVMVSIPISVKVYNDKFWDSKIPDNAKVFTLTGHIDKGWIIGEVKAMETVTFHGKNQILQHPVIKVLKGDRVVLKLTSSDVIHGFSLKDFGIYVKEGIVPGKVILISFIADKTGTFSYTCNAICGENHEKMRGTLVVET